MGDDETEALFRRLEGGDHSVLPELGAALRRAGRTLNDKKDDRDKRDLFGAFYFPDEMPKAWPGATWAPWSPPPVGTFVLQNDGGFKASDGREIPDEWRLLGEVVGAVTGPRFFPSNHMCPCCTCKYENTGIGVWLVRHVAPDGRVLSRDKDGEAYVRHIWPPSLHPISLFDEQPCKACSPGARLGRRERWCEACRELGHVYVPKPGLRLG